MYIKQILYLLEKFVTVLGGEHRPAWSPYLLSLPLGAPGFPVSQELSWPLI